MQRPRGNKSPLRPERAGLPTETDVEAPHPTRSAGCKLLVGSEYPSKVGTCEEMRDLVTKVACRENLEWQLKAEGLFGRSCSIGSRYAYGCRRLSGGFLGLETRHGSGPANYAMSERCMDAMVRLLD